MCFGCLNASLFASLAIFPHLARELSKVRDPETKNKKMSRSPRNRSHSYSRSRSRSPAGYRDGYEENNSTIFAGNLNHDTTADVLRTFFAANTRGNIVDVKVKVK